MKKFFSSIVPVNKIQKTGVFVSVLLVVIVLLLHSPWDGYVTSYDVQVLNEIPLPDGRALVGGGTHFDHTEALSIFDWRTAQPIIEWFGSIVHFDVAIIFICSVGLLWVWLFR